MITDEEIMKIMAGNGIVAVDPRCDTAQELRLAWILAAGREIAETVFKRS